MRFPIALFLLSSASCGTSTSQPDAARLDAARPDAARFDDAAPTCRLSGGCDFVVNGLSECPDPNTNPSFCSGICGGFECCWCEGTVPKTEFIDCFDGCQDAGPDAAPNAAPTR